MAVSGRMSGILPTIKCSLCNDDIPISHMGDHACSTPPPLPLNPTRLDDYPSYPISGVDGDFQQPAKSYGRTTPLSQRRPFTPDSDISATSIANRQASADDRDDMSRTAMSPRLPYATSPNAIGSRSASPAMSFGGRKSPYQLPPRSMTSPIIMRRPSHEISLPQDSAFPVFPSPRTRSATPTTPLASSFPQSTARSPGFGPPLTATSRQSPPRDQNVEDVCFLDRVETTSPETTATRPFDYDQSQDESTRKARSRNSEHNLAGQRLSRSVDAAPRASTSSSVYTRMRSMSTVSGASQLACEAPAIPRMPSMAQEICWNPDPGNTSSTIDVHRNAFDFESLPARATDYPISPRDLGPSATVLGTSFTAAPVVSLHRPRPSVAAAMQPLYSIGSTASFRPSRSIKERTRSQSMNRSIDSSYGSRIVPPEEVPPMPAPIITTTQTQDRMPLPMAVRRTFDESASPIYTPHDSFSSSSSYGSGVKTGSSRSSPPLQESPRRRDQDVAGSRHGGIDAYDFQKDNDATIDHFAPHGHRRPMISDRSHSTPPEYARPPSLSAIPTIPYIVIPEPPSPTLQYASTISSPDDYIISSSHERFNSRNLHLHLSPAPTITPPPASPTSSSGLSSSLGAEDRRARSRGPADKGPCRGCGERIFGKSVTSSDGQLSGRFHKACFVCKTCSNPFQTADFYVLGNNPYCSRHYHELNHSLCRGCDRGIEGQYLETESWQKYHSYCFTCQDCHRILRDDYYEWNGRTLCEQHAFRAAQQPSSNLGVGAGSMHGRDYASNLGAGLNGARRYPERRSTKLMMM